MRGLVLRRLIPASACLLFVWQCGGDAAAQGARTASRRQAGRVADVLKITEMEGVGRRSLVSGPQYRTNVARGVKPPEEWSRIQVTYDTAPEWIDELTFQYFVLTEREQDDAKAYSLFKNTVRYADIEQGRDHMSTVFLRPSTVKRYGLPVAIAVEIRLKGEVIAEAAEAEIKVPEQWWRNPAVTQNEGVTTRDGYLLDRSQSPFALINIDDYEVIK